VAPPAFPLLLLLYVVPVFCEIDWVRILAEVGAALNPSGKIQVRAPFVAGGLGDLQCQEQEGLCFLGGNQGPLG
jgi:hypothetical protein